MTDMTANSKLPWKGCFRLLLFRVGLDKWVRHVFQFLLRISRMIKDT